MIRIDEEKPPARFYLKPQDGDERRERRRFVGSKICQKIRTTSARPVKLKTRPFSPFFLSKVAPSLAQVGIGSGRDGLWSFLLTASRKTLVNTLFVCQTHESHTIIHDNMPFVQFIYMRRRATPRWKVRCAQR